MGVETELKFRLPARRLTGLPRWRISDGVAGPRSETDLVSIYFDTPKHKLKRHGISLRVRRTGDKHIQTVKTAAGVLLGRGEWETEVKDGTPDLARADNTPLARMASRKLRRKLRPIFATSVHRVTWPIRTGRSEVELAIDRGRLAARRRSRKLEELEIELKTGQPDDLFRVAKALQRKAGAELYFRTKAERGYALACGEADDAVFAERIELDQASNARDAFQVVARSTLRHFSANADAVRNLQPEGVHQMRVGLRRLRAAISIFSKLLPRMRTEKIKTELKWLTGELAPAREIDVFVQEKLARFRQELAPARGRRAIEQEFKSRRERALRRAREAVSSDRYRTLLVDLLEWIETGPDLSQEAAGLPIRKFATETLRRRLKKARKIGSHLQALSTRERHKFRIRVKKIRYGVDFFDSVLAGKRQKKELARLSKHLKKIQDALGSLNDFAAHRNMASGMALDAPRPNRRARALVSGIVLGREQEGARPLLKLALAEVKKLPRARVFHR